VFSSMTMGAVGRGAHLIVNEVRRQWKEIPGLMEGKAKPDYKQCVDIVTKNALKEMMVPALLSVIVPTLVGLLIGVEALGALLAGAVVFGLLTALLMANSGGAWDNAKKLIEAGNFGGKGSFAHKAAVVGDTVGDPFKDTSGPSLNVLIKILGKVAMILAPLLILFWGR
ncbi:MAG TPA: sodium/proton-translocating pyrophosphatase, partial [Acidobacteriota bacterium]|nr:sodium/proton-translocating pyrophosphatase [Acidobacteriota bacterium]